MAKFRATASLLGTMLALAHITRYMHRTSHTHDTNYELPAAAAVEQCSLVGISEQQRGRTYFYVVRAHTRGGERPRW